MPGVVRKIGVWGIGQAFPPSNATQKLRHRSETWTRGGQNSVERRPCVLESQKDWCNLCGNGGLPWPPGCGAWPPQIDHAWVPFPSVAVSLPHALRANWSNRQRILLPQNDGSTLPFSGGSQKTARVVWGVSHLHQNRLPITIRFSF